MTSDAGFERRLLLVLSDVSYVCRPRFPQVDCTAGVLCSFMVALAFSPQPNETVTVVLKPEPGGQDRVRFVTPSTFVPVSDVNSDNSSASLLVADTVRRQCAPLVDEREVLRRLLLCLLPRTTV